MVDGSLRISTTKTGRHDIAEIMLKVALKHQKSNQLSPTIVLELNIWHDKCVVLSRRDHTFDTLYSTNRLVLCPAFQWYTCIYI